MNWETAHAQEIGGREEQQDRVTVLIARDGTERLLVVADGAGGHKDGARAAQAVIDAATDRWHKHLVQPASPEALLGDLCRGAHDRIVALGGSGRHAPRSTCAALYANDKIAYWANVGDSRVYHFRRGQVADRSKDHSVVQMLVDMGKIDEGEMGKHPDQNRLTQSLGGDKPPEPHFGRAAINDGDGFLLCTDGLWETVSADEMAACLAEASLGHAAKTMARQAARRGGPDGDNISLALARARPVRRRVPRLWLLAALVAAAGAAVGFVVAIEHWLGSDGAAGLDAPEAPRQTTPPGKSAPGGAGAPDAAPRESDTLVPLSPDAADQDGTKARE